jgi:hypothetical protein
MGLGLLTVWCLGCTSLDSLVETLVSGDCDAAMTMAAVQDGQTSPTSAIGPTAISPAHVDACGCVSCHAPSPPLALVADATSPTPQVDAQAVSRPASVTHDLLTRPPALNA